MQKRSMGPSGRRRRAKAIGLLMVLLGIVCAAGCIGWGKKVELLGLFATEEEAELGMELLWSLPLELDAPVTDVYLLPRTLCVVAEDSTLVAIDAEKGFTRWQQFFQGEPPLRAAEDDNHVYVIAGGKLFLLDRNTGEATDRRQLSFCASSQPVVDATYLYAGSADGRLWAVDLGPRLGWHQTAKSAVSARPQVDAAGAYFATEAGTVYAVGLVDGTRKWEFSVDQPVVAGLTLGANVLYVGSLDGRLYALDTALGVSRKQQQVWLVPSYTGGSIRQAPVLRGGTVYLVAEGSGVHAVRAADGTRMWQFEDADAFLAAGENRVFLGARSRELICVDRGTGEERWRRSLADRRGYFFIVNEVSDLIYVCQRRSGKLFCYRPR